MTIDFNDKTGQMRSPHDFREAASVVQLRILSGLPQTPEDIQLFIQFTTILEALRIAEVVSAKHYGQEAS